MNTLKINYNQNQPTQFQIKSIWEEIDIQPINNWSASAKNLITAVNETHENGGIQLHQYEIRSNESFNWFAARNRLNEMRFVEQFFQQHGLEEYRSNLEIYEPPKVSIHKEYTDSYGFPGMLARILGLGGAYKSLPQENAWEIATQFVKAEFQNRFEEIIWIEFSIQNANWLDRIVWDNSFLLFDKRYNRVTIIDITDSD